MVIRNEDILDMFPEPDGGILLIMDEKHLQNFQPEVKVTFQNTVKYVDDVRIGGRGRIGVKLSTVPSRLAEESP